jgi:hypothetical protein
LGFGMTERSGQGVFIQELGADLPLVNFGEKSKLFLTLNYRFHKSNTDYLDGYNPTRKSNLHNDVYHTYAVGAMFKF